MSPVQAFTGEAGEVGDGTSGAPQETATWAAGETWRHKRLSAPCTPTSGSQGGGGSMKLGGRGTERNLVSIWLQQSAWLGLGVGLGLGLARTSLDELSAVG